MTPQTAIKGQYDLTNADVAKEWQDILSQLSALQSRCEFLTHVAYEAVRKHEMIPTDGIPMAKYNETRTYMIWQYVGTMIHEVKNMVARSNYMASKEQSKPKAIDTWNIAFPNPFAVDEEEGRMRHAN